MSSFPKILSVETIARSRLFRIERLQMRFGNGVETEYERLGSAGDGAVMICALLPGREVLLVREYAAGMERYELSLPKGRIDPGEDAQGAAQRELIEETGFAAKTMEPLIEMTTAPGYLQHATTVMVAEGLSPQSSDEGDEPEPLELIRWPLERLAELVAQPDLTEARTIAALFMVRDLLWERDKNE